MIKICVFFLNRYVFFWIGHSSLHKSAVLYFMNKSVEAKCVESYHCNHGNIPSKPIKSSYFLTSVYNFNFF